MLPSTHFVTKQRSESAVAYLHLDDNPLQGNSCTCSSKLSVDKVKQRHIPLDASTLIRYDNVRLGLRGGSPMWPTGGGNNRETWPQKQSEGREPEVCRRQGSKGRGHISSDKNASTSNPFLPSGSSLEDLATARAKVASLVAADYNDFDDENSQLTPPDPKETPAKLTDPKSGGRNPSLDVEISSELELLAESENIVIIDHMSDDNIVVGSDVIEECIISTSNMDLVDSKEKIEQVVEEDEQHVVMMIEENTLTASFSVEQRDKLMSETVVRKLKPLEDSEAACMSGFGGNDTNDGTVVKSSCSSEVQGENRSVDVNPLASTILTPSLAPVEDEITVKNANTPSIIDSQGAMNLVQKRSIKEITDSAANSGVKTDVMNVADSFENNSVSADREMKNNNESRVLDLSTTVQDCTKAGIEGVGIPCELNESKEENANKQAASSQQIIPSVPLPVNKALKGVGQMLMVADSPDSPDQQEVNVDPSPEPLFHEFDPQSNKSGQGTESLTLPSAKHREIFTTHLPKDTSVSVRAKESISALLKEEPKKPVETSSSVVSLTGNRGVSCVPVRPAVTVSTKSKPSTNVDPVGTKPTLSEQQSFIVSRGAVSISLLDPSASSSIVSPCINKSSSNKSDTSVGDVISIQRRKRPEQPTHKEKTMCTTETSVVPVYQGEHCVPVVSDSGSLATTTSAVNLGLSSLVCSALSTVTISVITTTPKVSSQTPTDSATSTTLTEAQLSSSYTNKITAGVKSKAEPPASTAQSLQATIASSVPSSSACTLTARNAGVETYVPLTGIASSAQVSQLLNLPARSLQTLIENNQLFKSCPSTSQNRNIPLSSTQSIGEPVSAQHEGTGTKSMQSTVEIQAPLKSNEMREDESSQPHTMPVSRNNESTLHLGGKTKTMPSLDVTSKFLDQSKSTMEQNSSVTVTKTTSQVHPQIVSVLESRLMSSSEYSSQQTPVMTSTGNTSSLQPDNSSARTIPSQTYSRQVSNTATNASGMVTSSANIVTSHPNQSVSPQSSVSFAKGNTSMASQQPSSLIQQSNIKEEKMDDNLMSSSSGQAPLPDIVNSCKISLSNRLEESQNVLLKQLLQNTGCAQTQSTISVPSLEAQLAQPVPSTPSALLSPLLLDTVPPMKPDVSPVQRGCMPISRTPSREDVFSPLPSPKREAPPTMTSTPQASPRREAPPVLSSPKREAPQLLVSPKREAPPPQAPPTQALSKQDPSPMASPSSLLSPKREVPFPQASPNRDMQLGLVEIKKEVMEEGERKSEFGHIPDQSPSDIKKMKRRQYQQKRRQSQGKEAIGGPAKKRQKKVTTVEEDWDTYMENLMQNLQQLPPIHVQEPSLPSNPIVGNIFGAGDLTKLVDGNSSGMGELHGTYGNANLFQVSDYYDSKPFGPCIPLPPPLPVSTQRGFYDQEFAPLKFGNDSEDKKSDAPARDFDSPQSVISSSSPECLYPEPPIMFPGLRLINPDSDEEDSRVHMSSPVLPLLAPVPIRLMPVIKEVDDIGKENKGSLDDSQPKSRPLTGIPLRDSGNVAVTLTLSSAAADDIVGVLRDLANFLHIPPPSSYQIVERTNTPPSQKLGLYRSKGKDGKEGAPIDIQSILNGEAKFCRHCDVVILNNSIKKKVSDLPFLAKEDIPDNEDFLNFCSTSCYMQFALMHRLPSITQDKAAATVDHLCQAEVSVKATKIKEEVKTSSNDDTKKSDGTLCSSLFEKGKDIEKPSAEVMPEPSPAKAKNVCYKTWSPGALQPAKKMKKTTDREMTEMLFRMGITVMPPKIPEDTRSCIFCHHIGDGIADGPARLLNYDVDRWVHLNCALWSDDVYETVNGALMNLDNALKQSLTTSCVTCHKNGASIRCFKLRCSNVYHLSCAVKSECVFFKNKTMYCTAHIPKNEKDNELTTLAVFRRVYVDRDENRQVASVMHRSDHNHLMRVGSLIFLNVGQLLPHQLQAFHTINCIYPIGYKIVRFYWSMRVHNKRCRYVCTIHDVAGRPEFRVLVQEPNQDDLELRDSSPKAVWARILEPMALMRKEMGGIQVFPRFVSGEDLFGLTEPAIVRILESLPGVESMNDYRFKYGRNPLLELPLAVNPTGSARSEPKLRIAYPWKRPHTQRTATSSRPVFVPTATVAGEAACPYSKQFVHSKSSQYKKMKQDWRNNVYLARSKIQGLGLYAARDLERHMMVIEYIGEVIRTELSELREKLYEARNRGIYMFRLDEERVVDATLSGGLARYINHSCNPNCVAEIVEVDRDLRIIIFAKKRISRGEELAYDYKFDIEDDQHKIPCNCGAANCKKWMN